MQLSKLLTPQAVKVMTSVTSKKRLMQSIGELASQTLNIPADKIVEALLARESLGPTGVGQGVALPHARLAGLDEVAGAFVLLDKPIDFNAVDRQPVDIAFALFAPENAGVEHLKALALVSRTLREPSVCAKLRANHDPATLYTILTEAQSVQAA
ncbi:MAG: PTS sugar transporter subunit IIA [Sulfitobacter sp.]